jgi:hypothetical protein
MSFSIPLKQGKKYTMVSLGTASGTVFRINRGNQDIYQALPLDTNIIALKTIQWKVFYIYRCIV